MRKPSSVLDIPRRINELSQFTTSSFTDVDIYSNSEDLGSHFVRLQRIPNIAKQIDDAVFGIWAAAYKELLDPPTFVSMARQIVE